MSLCFIIYIDVAGILVLIAHVKFYFFNRHRRNDIFYWDIKWIKLSSILALAFVRHILSFLAHVAPDFSVLFLFICQIGLSILKILGEKELRQLKSDFIQYCCPPFLPSNLRSVWLVGWEWQEDNASEVIIDDIAVGRACFQDLCF